MPANPSKGWERPNPGHCGKLEVSGQNDSAECKLFAFGFSREFAWSLEIRILGF